MQSLLNIGVPVLETICKQKKCIIQEVYHTGISFGNCANSLEIWIGKHVSNSGQGSLYSLQTS